MRCRLAYIPLVLLAGRARRRAGYRPGAFVLPGDSSVERLGSPRGLKEPRVEPLTEVLTACDARSFDPRGGYMRIAVDGALPFGAISPSYRVPPGVRSPVEARVTRPGPAWRRLSAPACKGRADDMHGDREYPGSSASNGNHRAPYA